MKFLTKHPWNCTKSVPWNHTFSSLSSSSLVYEEMLLKYLSSCGFTFSHLKLQYFPLHNFFLIYFRNKTRWILSLVVPCFVFNFMAKQKVRKHKWRLIPNHWYKINLKNKQAKNIFYSKSKLNRVSVLALPDWQLYYYARYQKMKLYI